LSISSRDFEAARIEAPLIHGRRANFGDVVPFLNGVVGGE
jgi:hypothetical protein